MDNLNHFLFYNVAFFFFKPGLFMGACQLKRPITERIDIRQVDIEMKWLNWSITVVENIC